MIEISKELLSEVYNFEVNDFVQLGTDDVTYEVRFNGLKNGTNYNIINIYELAHRCKTWAVNLCYELVSFIRAMDTVSRCEIWFEYHQNFHKIVADTEPEAIFKACEWILKEIKND